MKEAKIAQLKNNLSSYLKYVRKGGRVRVLDRDEPVADLVPVSPQGGGDEGETESRLRSLESRGIVRRGGAGLPPDLLVAPEGPPAGALDALLEERKTGR